MFWPYFTKMYDLFSPCNSDWLPDSERDLLHHLGILWLPFSVVDSLPCPIPLKMIVAPMKTWIQMTAILSKLQSIHKRENTTIVSCHLYSFQLKEFPVLSRFFPNQKFLTGPKLISNLWCQNRSKRNKNLRNKFRIQVFMVFKTEITILLLL